MSRKRSRKNCTSLLSFLVNLSSWLGLLILVGSFLLLGLWFLARQFWIFKTPKNILFVTNNFGSSERNFYLAQYNYQTGNYSLNLSPVEIEWGSGKKLRLVASWQLGLLVDEVVTLPAKKIVDNKDLLKALRTKLLTGGELSFRKRIKYSQVYFSFKKVDPVKISIQSDFKITPVTSDQLSQCSMAVVNTTNQGGLASAVTEIIEESGGKVVRLTDQMEPYQLSMIILASEIEADPCQIWGERLQAIFPQELSREDQPELRQKHRADLVIMIGQELAKVKAEFNEKL